MVMYNLLRIALGEIPSVIYNCKELTYLDLSTNPLGRYVCVYSDLFSLNNTCTSVSVFSCACMYMRLCAYV